MQVRPSDNDKLAEKNKKKIQHLILNKLNVEK
jgi:hypothetical protein